MTQEKFYNFLHRRIAQVSVGASSLRNQGGSGIIAACRHYFQYDINLTEFIQALPSEVNYFLFLNRHTDNLIGRFQTDAQRWGAARKGLNLFLRDVVYNNFFSVYFGLPNDLNEFNKTVQHLEVPLDKLVALGVDVDCGGNVPEWQGIRYLTPDDSKIYQEQAALIAAKENTIRIHLDLKYYRPE